MSITRSWRGKVEGMSSKRRGRSRYGILGWCVSALATLAPVLPAESQVPPTPDLSECSLDFIDGILNKCGPSADPKDWYSPLNECTIKAEEAFNLCRDAGHEARIIAIDCDPGPGHMLTQCLLDGKYLTFIDTAAADPARGVLVADKLLSALQNLNPPITPPLTSLFSGETLRDEVACILADRDPTSSDLRNRGCGCIWNPLKNRSSCSCSAKILNTYPASGPANTSFCAKSEELSPSGFDPEDCSTCCQNRYRVLMDMEKSTCETFIDSCQLLNWENVDVGPGGIGISDELFGKGLIAAWRCGQWSKQAKTFLDGCKKSCTDAAGKLP